MSRCAERMPGDYAMKTLIKTTVVLGITALVCVDAIAHPGGHGAAPGTGSLLHLLVGHGFWLVPLAGAFAWARVLRG